MVQSPVYIGVSGGAKISDNLDHLKLNQRRCDFLSRSLDEVLRTALLACSLLLLACWWLPVERVNFAASSSMFTSRGLRSYETNDVTHNRKRIGSSFSIAAKRPAGSI